MLQEWILSTPQQSDTDIPLALSVRQTLVRTTVRGDPMEPFFREITIERQFETGTQSETHLIGVQGGTVSGRRADGSPTGLNTHHAVKWDENALVFESGSYTGPYPETGAWPERRETWSLEADGRLRVAITRRSSGDGSSYRDTAVSATVRRATAPPMRDSSPRLIGASVSRTPPFRRRRHASLAGVRCFSGELLHVGSARASLRGPVIGDAQLGELGDHRVPQVVEPQALQARGVGQYAPGCPNACDA